MNYYLRGQVAKATGLNVETLRFYEKIGLIPVPEKKNDGYRIYTDNFLDMLEFIAITFEGLTSSISFYELFTKMD